jgi:hypothetical protein
MIVTFRPLTAWGHPETPRHLRKPRHTFRAPWSSTLDLLAREVRALAGGNVIIGAFLAESAIRLDGMPRSGAPAPLHPGIELSFDSRHGRLTYATDVYDHYEANVRAIALALEALRAVDRYGVSRRGEQYAGWRALASGAGADVPDTLEDAWGFLEHLLGEDLDRREDPRGVLRRAAKRAHPDVGGDPTTFRRFEAARRLVLGAA